MRFMPLLVSGLLVTVFMAATAFGASSGSTGGSGEMGASPLYDYRYTQAVEDLGILSTGASEGKVSFGSIPTSSLNANVEAPCKGKACDVTQKGDGDTILISCTDGRLSTCSDTCTDSCGSTCTDSCGSTCADSCGSTCSSSCGDSCGSTCAASCGSTCINTCTDSCGSTCTDSCGSTCINTCGSTCASTCNDNTCGIGPTCVYTCISTCSDTCGSTCAASCGSTCSLKTCASICGSTCGGTCGIGPTCVYTCLSTCASTCGSTCGSTCAASCGGTCSLSTCASTCRGTCIQTCSQTCAPTCGQKCIPRPVPPAPKVPSANFTSRAPPQAGQNVLIPYDVTSFNPATVYYRGAFVPWEDFSVQFHGNYLLSWIDLAGGAWGIEAMAPQGTWVREFIYVPSGGNLVMNRMFADSIIRKDYGYTQPGYKYVWFYVDKKGTHVILFTLGNLQSNKITLYAY